MPSENSREGVLPHEKHFFHRGDTRKVLPCGRRRRLRHKLRKSTGAFRRRVVTRSEKKTGKQKMCNFTILGRQIPWGRIVRKLVCSMMLGRKSYVQNLVLIGQGVLSRRTLEKQPFPLKASIAYTTLPCADALACDAGFGIFTCL
jgi:hypothetical protein